MRKLCLLAVVAVLCGSLALPALADGKGSPDALAPEVPLITIEGPITQLGPDYVVVNCLTVYWTDDTEIVGRLVVGAEVVIEAYVLPHDYVAKSIKVIPTVTDVAPRIVTFGGIIRSIGQPIWEIGGRKVTVTRCTIIIGQPAVGRWARVRALRRYNGELLALIIRVWPNWPQKVEFTGRIEVLPPGLLGRWMISGRTVWVNRHTEIIGRPRVGYYVKVNALRYPHRPLIAVRIEVLRPQVTAVPYPTATPTPWATP